MKRSILFNCAAASAITALSANVALADSIADCGNIDVEANAQCEVKASGGCTVDDCTPVSCSATLYAECQGQCNATPPSCDVSCQGSCEADCNVDPGSFDCSADCTGSCDASCSGDCSAKCASDANSAECEAKCEGTCKATCQGDCDASCTGTPPEATCQAKCQGSCQGSCNAQAHLDCQLSCRAEGEASCTGGCEVACEQPEGALFCDGQYVDHGGNLDSCVAALKDKLNIEVTGYATADASGQCSGSTCEGEASAKAGASCAMVPGSRGHGPWSIALGLGLVAFGAGMRRRRRNGFD